MRIRERFAKVTVRQIFGHAETAGISIITSGTTVVSVSATGVKSGDVIMTNPYMYGAATTVFASSLTTFFVGAIPTSVRAGAFELTAIGSRAPTVDMPVAWAIVHR